MFADWRPLYPFQTRTHLLPDGVAMRFVDEGPRDGAPVVLCIHGNPSWSFLYRDLVRELAAAGRRCVAPDQVGMGFSDHPDPAAHPHTLAQRIADLESLWQGLGEPEVDLVVHDWGGAVGLGFAGRHPEKVRRLVLLNTAAFTDRHLPRRIALIRLPILGELAIRGANAFARAAVRMATVRRGGLEPAVAAGFLAPYSSPQRRRGIWGFVRDIPMRPSHPSWGQLQAVERGLACLQQKPVLLLWGLRDFCFGPHFLAEFQRRLPQAQVEAYADAGHYVLEDAGPAARARIAAFL